MAAILIVDDDAHVRNLISDAVSAEGFTVGCARNGAEAVAMLRREEDWDLVVSDLHMPVMDGRGLLAHLARTLPDLPVILVSGDPEAASLPCFAALAKPVNTALLLDTIDQALLYRLGTAWGQRLA